MVAHITYKGNNTLLLSYEKHSCCTQNRHQAYETTQNVEYQLESWKMGKNSTGLSSFQETEGKLQIGESQNAIQQAHLELLLQPHTAQLLPPRAPHLGAELQPFICTENKTKANVWQICPDLIQPATVHTVHNDTASIITQLSFLFLGQKRSKCSKFHSTFFSSSPIAILLPGILLD